MSSEAQAEFRRGQAALKAGNQSETLSGFLMALALDPENRDHRTQALSVLGKTGGYTSLPRPVLDGLARCAEDPDLDLQPLALVVRTSLDHNPSLPAWLDALQRDTDALESALSQGLFDSLLTDPLVLAVLTHAVNISLDLEDIVTSLRRHALACVYRDGYTVLLSRHRTFFTALALQAERTDFAWAQTPREQDWLSAIHGKEDEALIRSAYDKPSDHPLPDVPALTSIDNATSCMVQEQYTTYPYPRWERLMPSASVSLNQMLAARFPNDSWPARFDGPVTGLSAGCGTGRGALMLAQSVRNLSLTAMDLSPRSLAFAQSRADELGIGNVAFGLGDILHAKDLGKTFDIIESSGVLHHMADPLAGLNALVSCLAPDGIMRIALYSDRARAAVVAARDWIAAEGIPDTADGIRQTRSALRALPQEHPAKPVTNAPEFFSLSGLHDLVFNVQEHRFTPKALKTLLAKAGVQLLGFDHTDPSVSARYSNHFPDDPSQTNLDNWDAFEQNHPDTFAEMYQMWCKPVTRKR